MLLIHLDENDLRRLIRKELILAEGIRGLKRCQSQGGFTEIKQLEAAIAKQNEYYEMKDLVH